MSSSTLLQQNAQTIATNVRRLMARGGFTFRDVVEITELDERTIRGVVRGVNQPHSLTLHKLAEGLGVPIDELFQPLAAAPQLAFDRATNPVVETVVHSHPQLFYDWSDADFDELYSHFGTGGALVESGVLAAATAINDKRSLLRQVSVILESGESELLSNFVTLLYRRVVVSETTDDDPQSPAARPSLMALSAL